ncbi:MAG: hypothetical protein KC657_12555 [Myxococcales bacterium]|nr:hypothetical protein [Myxococcales bacterium]
MKLALPDNERVVRASCYLALVALPLMVWSIFDPRVWPVLVALSVGQAIGTASFALFIVAVVRDLGVRRKLKEQAARDSAP